MPNQLSVCMLGSKYAYRDSSMHIGTRQFEYAYSNHCTTC